MACLAQTQELEALIQQRKSAYIHAITEKKRGYRKCYMDFDNIERANKPDNASERTSLLGEQSKKILSVATQKLKKDKYFPVTHLTQAHIFNKAH